VAIHLAQWVSPVLAVKVAQWVARYIAGDISLVPEVVARHDVVNDTTSRVAVATVSNEVLEAEKRVAVLKQENDQLALRQKLELHDLDIREKNLVLQKREIEQKLKLEDAAIERKRIQLQVIKSAEDDIHTYTALKYDLIAPIASAHPENAILQNKDLTTLAAELGFRRVPTETLSAIGSIISAGYRNRYGMRPPKTRKLCNGSNRSVNVYTEWDYGWIRDILRDELPKFVGVPDR